MDSTGAPTAAGATTGADASAGLAAGVAVGVAKSVDDAFAAAVGAVAVVSVEGLVVGVAAAGVLVTGPAVSSASCVGAGDFAGNPLLSCFSAPADSAPTG